MGLMLIILSACNQSVNKDLKTEAYSRGDGLGCDDIYININGEQINRNAFELNSKIKIVFDDVNGFNKEDGKAYPGISMKIIANEAEKIADFPDLLAELKNGTDLNPMILNASFITAPEYFNASKKYELLVKIWDKKGNGSFTYELPFTIIK